MGLDVGLYYSDDWDFGLECEKAENDFGNEYYTLKSEAEALGRQMVSYQEYMTRPDVFQKYKKYLSQEKRGVFEFDSGIHSVNEDSPRHPTSYFKIGYFRSSYNDSGINNVLRSLGLPDLYDIFSIGDRYDYYVQVDWASAKERIVEVIEAFKPVATDYYVVDNTRSKYSGMSALELLGFVIKKKSERPVLPDFFKGSGFLCSGVDFHADDTELIASTGKYIVCRTKGVDGLAGYLDLLEVVEDCIDYVLKQKHPEKYRLGWSA